MTFTWVLWFPPFLAIADDKGKMSPATTIQIKNSLDLFDEIMLMAIPPPRLDDIKDGEHHQYNPYSVYMGK